jgi:hypothetical protein
VLRNVTASALIAALIAAAVPASAQQTSLERLADLPSAQRQRVLQQILQKQSEQYKRKVAQQNAAIQAAQQSAHQAELEREQTRAEWERAQVQEIQAEVDLMQKSMTARMERYRKEVDARHEVTRFEEALEIVENHEVPEGYDYGQAQRARLQDPFAEPAGSDGAEGEASPLREALSGVPWLELDVDLGLARVRRDVSEKACGGRLVPGTYPVLARGVMVEDVDTLEAFRELCRDAAAEIAASTAAMRMVSRTGTP